MASEWIESKLKDVSDDITVGFVGSMSSLFIDRGVPLLRGQNIQPGRLDLTNLKYISTETHQKWKKSALKAGDVVIVRVGYPGTSCVIPEKMGDLNAASLVIVRPNNSKLDSHFLCYVLNSKVGQQLIHGRLVGSVQQVFNTGTAASLELLLPPLPEQKRIAYVLGALDEKIELNRRMNATLEAMARALFQSWFVNFDPVRRNAEGGDSRPEDALFPDSFEDSLIGEIPKGWKSAKVSEICKNIFSGGTPRTSEVSYWDGAFPWLSSGETRNSFIIETEKTITQLGIDKSSTRQARKGCVVIASAGQGHTRGQTSMLAFDSYINQSVVALAADNDIASDLFLYLDLSRRYEQFRQLSDSHSSRGSLTTKLLGGVQVVLPAKNVIQKFDSIVKPLVARIIANLHESRSLASLRDTLLPPLLSGAFANYDQSK